MDLINTPMSRVTCPNVENPENQAVQFWAFRVKMPKKKPAVNKYFSIPGMLQSGRPIFTQIR